MSTQDILITLKKKQEKNTPKNIKTSVLNKQKQKAKDIRWFIKFVFQAIVGVGVYFLTDKLQIDYVFKLDFLLFYVLFVVFINK